MESTASAQGVGALASPKPLPNSMRQWPPSKKQITKAIRLAMQAVIGAGRLVGVVFHRHIVVLKWLFRLPGMLGKMIQRIISSKAARLFALVAASLVCISLRAQRSTGATVQLSSSLSLLFGIIKVQGSLTLQLGLPRREHGADKDGETHGEELRIACPKDLKDHIVRFLEAQAARHPATAPTWQLSPERAAPTGPRAGPEAFRSSSAPPFPCHYQGAAAGAAEVAAGAVSSAATADGGGSGDGGGAVDVAAGRSAAGGSAARGSANGSGDMQTLAAPATPATAGVEAHTAATIVPEAGAQPQAAVRPKADPQARRSVCDVVPAVEALLPSTPPLAASPPEKAPAEARLAAVSGPSPSPSPLVAAAAATIEPKAWAEAPLGTTEYAALMSYAAAYRASPASLASSTAATEETESEAAEIAGGAAGGGRDGSGKGPEPGGLRRLGPDSILGLHGMGLEGWSKGYSNWERLHMEEM